MKLLTSNNTKIKKGEKFGFMTWGIHLAPAKLSGFNTCKDASKGCAAACLNTAGMGAYSTVQKARIEKTKLFFSNKNLFLSMLWKEVAAAIKKAEKNGFTPVFRLNLTSDLPWENIKHEGKNIMESFPQVQFMDYTKSPTRMSAFLSKSFPKNYHLTFSRSETNGDLVIPFLKSKGNVAVVFNGGLPKKWNGFTVISGDENDLRFLDGKGKVVGLKGKRFAKVDKTGFAINGLEVTK